MGKISRALDRAARTDDTRAAGRPETGRTGQHPVTVGATVSPPAAGPDRPRPQRAVLSAGQWDPRLSRAVTEIGPVVESLRTLRTRILHPADGRVPRSVLITSASPGEGKSFLCAGLGIILAQGVDHYSLMVDCDLRRPALHKMFGLRADMGLSNFLRDGQPLASLLMPTGVDALSLLPAGPPPVNPSELLGSESMIRLVDELEGRYDDRVILLDSPPLPAASETAILARRVDRVVLVVRWGVSRREHIRRLIDQVGPEKIVGVVFNAHRATVLDTRVFGDYGYGYYYDRPDD